MIGPLVFELTHKAEDGRPVVVLTETMYRPEGDPVPKGFQTDFFSMPCVVRWIWPPFAPGCGYAVGHDCDCNRNVDKGLRSLWLYRGLRRERVPLWKAKIIYWTVLYWPFSEMDPGVLRHRRRHRHGRAAASSDAA